MYWKMSVGAWGGRNGGEKVKLVKKKKKKEEKVNVEKERRDRKEERKRREGRRRERKEGRREREKGRKKEERERKEKSHLSEALHLGLHGDSVLAGVVEGLADPREGALQTHLQVGRVVLWQTLQV